MISFDTAATITPAVLDHALSKGVRVIMVYLKYLTPELLRLVWSKGIGVGLIFETTAERGLGGAPAGKVDGTAAFAKVASLASSLGVAMPGPGVAVWFTFDFDEESSQNPTCLAYAVAASAALGSRLETGAYGNGGLDQDLLDAKAVRYTWVAGGPGMRGTKAFLATGRADIVQDVGDKAALGLGIDIDSDTVRDPAAPWAWWPPLPAVAPPLIGGSQVLTISLDTQAHVRAAQAALRQAGLYTGAIDGVNGAGTKDALARWS